MTGYPGWMCLGGAELINSCRVGAYVEAGIRPEGAQIRDCGCCCGLDRATGFPLGFTTPWNDPAPWYDPSVPESIEFAGLLVTEVTGLEPGPITRTVTELASGDGSVLGRAMQSSPVITVTGLLIASTCCGAQYGLRWLRRTLTGGCVNTGDGGCSGEDLVYYTCCPRLPDEDCAENNGLNVSDLFEPYRRTLRNVGVVSGPDVVERIPLGASKGCSCCDQCAAMRVQFVLAAGLPCAYREPVEVITPRPLTCETLGTEITWVKASDDGTCGPRCPGGADCGLDPSCVLPSPPAMPLPTDSCVSCEPAGRCRNCLTIPAGTLPDGVEAVPVVTVFAGSLPLRRLRITWHENPLDRMAEELTICNACSVVDISYVAPWSTFTLDGTTGRNTITCPGGTPVNAVPIVTSDGGPYTMPILACPAAQYTMCVDAVGPIADDSSVSVSYVIREC